ncbi:hypothetical protein AMECASPLE_036955, partial [Ameca splendens]
MKTDMWFLLQKMHASVAWLDVGEDVTSKEEACVSDVKTFKPDLSEDDTKQVEVS